MIPPLLKKLRFNAGMRVYVVGAPAGETVAIVAIDAVWSALRCKVVVA